MRNSLWPENWSFRQRMNLSVINALLVMGLSFLGLLLLTRPIRENFGSAASLVATGVMDLLFVLVILIVYGVRKTAYDLLPRRHEISHDLRVGVKWGLVIFAITTVMGMIINFALTQLGVPPTPQHFVRELKSVTESWGLPLAVFVAVIAAPLGEEFLFRGIFHRTLATRLHPYLAVAVSGLLFALFHADWQQSLQLWVGGMGFALAYHRSHSLLGPVVAHMVLNSIPMIMMLFVTITV